MKDVIIHFVFGKTTSSVLDVFNNKYFNLHFLTFFVSALRKKTDHWTGCSDDGILSHFDRSRTKLPLN